MTMIYTKKELRILASKSDQSSSGSGAKEAIELYRRLNEPDSPAKK